MRNKRESEREVATLLGTLSVDGGDHMAPCVVLDLSSGGARLLVEEDLPLAGALELHMHSPRRVHRARAKWRNGDEVGVSFVTPDEGPCDGA